MPHDLNIRLEPLTAANWKQCADLPVDDSQSLFIPPNLHSIAAARFYPDNCCRAIYADDQMVGFALYGTEHPTRRTKIFRFMIAHPHQRRGYGRAALRAILTEIQSRWNPDSIYISYHDTNDIARRLYREFGFVEVERDGSKITACVAAKSSA